MKKLLLFLFIFVGIDSYGQVLNIPPVNLQAINGPTCLRGIDPEIIYDTLKAELLISDTSHWSDTEFKFISCEEAWCKVPYCKSLHGIEIEIDGGRRSSLVHSVPGFIVKQRGPVITFGEPDNGIRGYLDHKKRVFKKDIVVHSYVIVK